MSSADSILALQDFVSPVAAFVRDGGEVGTGHEIPIADHFGDWRLWCEDNGHKPGSVQTFGRDLQAVIPMLKVTRPAPTTTAAGTSWMCGVPSRHRDRSGSQSRDQ